MEMSSDLGLHGTQEMSTASMAFFFAEQELLGYILRTHPSHQSVCMLALALFHMIH